LHGSALTIEGQFQGVQAHAARPQEGKNPIESASLLLQLLREIRLQTSNNFSVEMTRLNAGGASSNVIPETASFTLDLRAPSNEIMDELKKQVTCLMKKAAELKETPINWKENSFAPAAQPNHQAINIVKHAIVKVLGEDALADPCISMGAEDFHFYTRQFPHIQATMLGLGCDLKPGLHHPKMTFCRESLIFGTQILIQALWEAAHIPIQEEVIRK
jgi:amidohydrolase